jgi:hypothetical protein
LLLAGADKVAHTVVPPVTNPEKIHLEQCMFTKMMVTIMVVVSEGGEVGDESD